MIFNGFRSNKRNRKDQQALKDSLLCKFVFDGMGHPIGESVSIDKDLIIVKADDSFLGIPLKHIESDGNKVIVRGLVDRKNAKILGERWRKKERDKEGILYYK